MLNQLRRGLIQVSLLVVFSPILLAQVTLHVKERVTTNLENFSHVGVTRVDSAGNAYFTPGFEGRQAKRARIVRVSSDGQKVLQYYLDRVPGFEKSEICDFAVTPDGDLLMVSVAGAEAIPWALWFDKDGTLRTKFKIEGPEFYPMQIAVFNNRDILIAGSTYTSDVNTRKPVLLLLDGSGSTMRQLSTAKDAKFLDERDAAGQTLSMMSFLSMSMIQTADDGNAYLLRGTSDCTILVVTPSGTIARRFSVHKPLEDASIVDFKVEAGRIAVLYWIYNKGDGSGNIAVYDADNGAQLSDFPFGSDVSNMGLISFSGYEFVLLGTNPQGMVEIQRATTR